MFIVIGYSHGGFYEEEIARVSTLKEAYDVLEEQGFYQWGIYDSEEEGFLIKDEAGEYYPLYEEEA